MRLNSISIVISGVIGGVIVGSTFVLPAFADTQIIEQCRQEPSTAARIACLESALGGVAETAPDDVAISESPVPPAESIMPALQPDDTETMDQLQVPLGNDNDDVVPDDEIGAEQLMTPQQREAELVRATDLRVASYKQVPFRRLVVYLENGQVWRQIKGDTQEVRANLRKNQTVDIEESSLGGYKLRLNEMQRTIRVRRVN